MPRPLVLFIALLTAAAQGQVRLSTTGGPASISEPRPTLAYRGVDASFVPLYEAGGVVWYDGQAPADPIELFASRGVNLLRLRVWVDPPGGWCSPEQTLAMARRGADAGMDLLIDFHYSDSWADPGQQWPPAAWAGLPLGQLADRVEAHTRDTLAALIDQGTPAAIVQIGNEVSNGMLWPAGNPHQQGWAPFMQLLSAGIAGVHAAHADSTTPSVMIHHDQGGNPGVCEWYFGQLQSLPYDAIGLSFYPWWHGSLNDLSANMASLAQRYGKQVMVVETAYPFTLGWADDQHNLVGLTAQLHPGFKADPEGQAAFLRALSRRVSAVPGGIGVCYWAPEFVAAPGLPSPWENLALFDFGHRVLPAAGTLGSGVTRLSPAP